MSADWSSSAFREALAAMVRRRVPAHEVDDVVQATLTEAFVSKTRPEEPEALRKWIWGIARNKVADYHRRARRETFDVPEIPTSAPTQGVDDILRWAMRELPPGQEPEKTLEWLLQEGEGEKLESIAERENLPATRVRQRVSRLRRHFKTRWAAQAAALAALGIVALLALVFFLRREKAPEPVIAHDTPHEPTPQERAGRMRRDALRSCENGAYEPCLDGLDRAKEIDPAGDTAEEIQRARRDATEHLAPPSPTQNDTKNDIKNDTKTAPVFPAPSAVPSSVPAPVPTTAPTWNRDSFGTSDMTSSKVPSKVKPKAAPKVAKPVGTDFEPTAPVPTK